MKWSKEAEEAVTTFFIRRRVRQGVEKAALCKAGVEINQEEKLS